MLKCHENDIKWEWNGWNKGVLELAWQTKHRHTRIRKTSTHHSSKSAIEWLIYEQHTFFVQNRLRGGMKCFGEVCDKAEFPKIFL